ncbi:MAG: COX15/CtaA family protein [Alphaproteobacteria bacterium]|nr:COX15/CtaA family protein [Alphaproteobacteria bacterium]
MTPAYAIAKEPFCPGVARWLFACALLVACMVLLGGYTRLSGSGLSITQWKPVHGVIPPLSQAAWQEEFAAYRQTPQYAAINSNMTLDGFRRIYWPEYAHRLLGRLAGAAFFLPFLWFSARRAFSPRFGVRLLLIFALGAAQGGVGWVMVKSGLADGPYVNHLRLAAHLALAFTLFALLLAGALDALGANAGEARLPLRMKKALCALFCALAAQIVLGALLAGLHGGLIYNTFPTMNGEWLPADALAQTPWWNGIFHNIAALQFAHRWLAALLGAGYLLWWWRARNYDKSLLILMLPLLVIMQFLLGIATLLTQASLPLAMAHQMTALGLFGLTVAILHGFSHSPHKRNEINY